MNGDSVLAYMWGALAIALACRGVWLGWDGAGIWAAAQIIGASGGALSMGLHHNRIARTGAGGGG